MGDSGTFRARSQSSQLERSGALGTRRNSRESLHETVMGCRKSGFHQRPGRGLGTQKEENLLSKKGVVRERGLRPHSTGHEEWELELL